jgi:hypothetical protein
MPSARQCVGNGGAAGTTSAFVTTTFIVGSENPVNDEQSEAAWLAALAESVRTNTPRLRILPP